MKAPFPSDPNMESAFAWIIYRIADEFEDHAILKGGMSLRLLDCPRSTNDLDYTFVPYGSKKEIVSGLEGILKDIPGAVIERSMTSKTVNFTVSVGKIKIQLEAAVAPSCKSIAMSTNSLARSTGQLGRIIRIMSFDVALSHKLAAWNERRLIRDLYDAYYIFRIIGERPDKNTFLERLSNIGSRIPSRKKIKKMNTAQFITELEAYSALIDDKLVENELSALLPKEERAGLAIKLKAFVSLLTDHLKVIG